MVNLFVYGTLQVPQVQQKVFGRVESGTVAKIPLLKMSELEIEGVIFKGLEVEFLEGRMLKVTAEELILIDLYETQAYKRLFINDYYVYVKNIIKNK